MDAERHLEARRDAFRKRKQGIVLSEKERQLLSDQQKAYAPRRTPIYFESEQQLKEWQSRARAEGYTKFSQWVVAQVQRAVAGELVDGVEHGRLQQRVEYMEREVDYHRKRSRELEEENKELRAETRRLTLEIAELTKAITELGESFNARR